MVPANRDLNRLRSEVIVCGVSGCISRVVSCILFCLGVISPSLKVIEFMEWVFFFYTSLMFLCVK